MDLKECYIDIETTGVPNKNRTAYDIGLIEIACIIEINKKEIYRFKTKVCPFKTDFVDEDALKINGVTRDEIFKYPQPLNIRLKLQQVFDKIVDKYNSEDKMIFIGYHAEFDYEILRAFFFKTNDEFFGSYFWFPPIDVMYNAIRVLKTRRHEMENFKLKTVAKMLGIDVDEGQLHQPYYDIELTKTVENKINEIYLKTSTK
jgi:DNA polymerase III epsilon subunit-like protein